MDADISYVWVSWVCSLGDTITGCNYAPLSSCNFILCASELHYRLILDVCVCFLHFQGIKMDPGLGTGPCSMGLQGFPCGLVGWWLLSRQVLGGALHGFPFLGWGAEPILGEHVHVPSTKNLCCYWGVKLRVRIQGRSEVSNGKQTERSCCS